MPIRRTGRRQVLGRGRIRVLGYLVLLVAGVIVTPTSAGAAMVGPGASFLRVDDRDPAVHYSGSWSTAPGVDKFDGADHYTDQAGASATLAFDGTSIAIIGAQAPWHGDLSVSVDGGPAVEQSAYAATRADRVELYRSPNLWPGPHTVTVSATGTGRFGAVVAVDAFTVGTEIEQSVVADRNASGWVTRSGNTLMLGGSVFRFAGSDEYYLGLDDNVRDAAGNPTYPPKARISNALRSAVAMGASVVRSHTLGISVGCSVCVEPTLGVFNDAAMDSADYAIYRAGQLKLKLMVPLTDQWRFYHGGESVFTGWFGYPNNPDLAVNAANNSAQRDAESHFYTDARVVSAYEAYIAHILNHVNPYTHLAYKNDPTIMAWETGNELWTANPAWTQQIAAFIKHTLGAGQLVADGSAADGMSVAGAALDAPDIDIVGGHFYPVDVAWMKNDAALAAAHDKAYVVGEFAWTDASATAQLISAVQSDRNISGDLFWVLMPYMWTGHPEPHGDGYAMYHPATDPAMGAISDSLTAHGIWMAAAR